MSATSHGSLRVGGRYAKLSPLPSLRMITRLQRSARSSAGRAPQGPNGAVFVSNQHDVSDGCEDSGRNDAVDRPQREVERGGFVDRSEMAIQYPVFVIGHERRFPAPPRNRHVGIAPSNLTHDIRFGVRHDL